MPPDAARPDGTFAIQDDEQYQPTDTVGDRHIRVRGQAGEGLLVCHASGAVDAAHRGAERLLVVVHGALRDAERYLGHAEAAAGQAGSRAFLVAPQFLADVDVAARAGVPDGALYWEVEGWKGGQPALGPAALSSFTAMDSLLQQLTEPGRLAENIAVVIVGNSAGGQYVNRYAAVGRAPAQAHGEERERRGDHDA